MSLPEGYLPRRGDELLIRAKVEYDCEVGEKDVHIKLIGAEHKSAILDLSDVHSLYFRKWNEGDKVICSGEFDGYASVIGISGEWVWVLVETGENEGSRFTLAALYLEPYVEAMPFNVLETIDPTHAESFERPMKPIGSQSVIGDDEEIKF